MPPEKELKITLYTSAKITAYCIGCRVGNILCNFSVISQGTDCIMTAMGLLAKFLETEG